MITQILRKCLIVQSALYEKLFIKKALDWKNPTSATPSADMNQ